MSDTKTCPECGSVDVKPTGNGHVVGVGQPHQEGFLGTSLTGRTCGDMHCGLTFQRAEPCHEEPGWMHPRELGDDGEILTFRRNLLEMMHAKESSYRCSWSLTSYYHSWYRTQAYFQGLTGLQESFRPFRKHPDRDRHTMFCMGTDDQSLFMLSST